jgi:hypothetical protein
LIITPPEKLTEEMNKDKLQIVANILDLDFLVFEELSTDYLAEGEADRWQTDLDFDPLAGNFLFDAWIKAWRTSCERPKLIWIVKKAIPNWDSMRPRV